MLTTASQWAHCDEASCHIREAHDRNWDEPPGNTQRRLGVLCPAIHEEPDPHKLGSRSCFHGVFGWDHTPFVDNLMQPCERPETQNTAEPWLISETYAMWHYVILCDTMWHCVSVSRCCFKPLVLKWLGTQPQITCHSLTTIGWGKSQTWAIFRTPGSRQRYQVTRKWGEETKFSVFRSSTSSTQRRCWRLSQVGPWTLLLSCVLMASKGRARPVGKERVLEISNDHDMACESCCGKRPPASTVAGDIPHT